MGDDWHRAWVAALDELESDAAQVEALLWNDHRVRDLPLANAWTPPPNLGPLPLDLRPRADAVLSGQLAAAQAITAALVTNRRQAEAATRIEAGVAPRRPSYLDCDL